MAFIDSEVIHRREEEQALKALEFEPATVDAIEITLFADQPPSILRLSLQPAELEAWIEKKSRPVQICNSAKLLGALRLVLGRSTGTEFPNPRPQFPIDNSTTSSPLPFSRQHYKLLCDRLRLPCATSGMLVSKTATSSTPHFQIHTLSTKETVGSRTQLKDTVNNIGITMKCRGSTLLGMKVSVTISHCRSSNITNAVLFCKSSAQAAHIGDTVMALAQVATHPALIPALLCNFHLDVLNYNMDTSWDRLFEVEAASGQTGILVVNDAGPVPTGDCDDPDLSKKATGVAQLAIAWENYSHSNVELIASISKFVASCDAASVEPDMRPIRGKQKQVIEEYLSLVFQRGTLLRQRATHLRARAEVQASTIYNHLAHKSNQINLSLAESSRRIAMEAQRDSAVMKSIAVLTMTFLPATYIASLFATPGVVSLGPSQGFYWAIALPLTFLVLLIWICWTWLTMRRIDRSAPPALSSHFDSQSARPAHILHYVDRMQPHRRKAK